MSKKFIFVDKTIIPRLIKNIRIFYSRANVQKIGFGTITVNRVGALMSVVGTYIFQTKNSHRSRAFKMLRGVPTVLHVLRKLRQTYREN